jgi:hypothetical protein
MQLHKSKLLPAAGRACAVCMHVHEDAFVRVAWGRLPFADSVSEVARGDAYWGQPSGSVSRQR